MHVVADGNAHTSTCAATYVHLNCHLVESPKLGTGRGRAVRRVQVLRPGRMPNLLQVHHDRQRQLWQRRRRLPRERQAAHAHVAVRTAPHRTRMAGAGVVEATAHAPNEWPACCRAALIGRHHVDVPRHAAAHACMHACKQRTGTPELQPTSPSKRNSSDLFQCVPVCFLPGCRRRARARRRTHIMHGVQQRGG